MSIFSILALAQTIGACIVIVLGTKIIFDLIKNK